MIEGVFDESIFEEATFQVDEIEAVAAPSVRDELTASFVQDHGPLTLLPGELAYRRKLWVKFLKDWIKLRREKIQRDEVALLALFHLLPDEAIA